MDCDVNAALEGRNHCSQGSSLYVHTVDRNQKMELNWVKVPVGLHESLSQPLGHRHSHSIAYQCPSLCLQHPPIVSAVLGYRHRLHIGFIQAYRLYI